MTDKSNNPFQFWEEIKRRNVHRSVAIYAGSAFVFLEAATIIFPRWGFPDWTIDLVLYLLILGAFITIIVSWIFDITPQGVQKTKPIEEITETEIKADSKVWKAATYISLVVIVGLIVLNIVGGGKQVRAGDIQSLVILPFENFTGDDQLDNMVSSMHSLLCGDMGRISGLRVIGKTSSKIYKDTDLSAKDIARELNVDAVLEPTIMCLGDSVCMQFRLVSTTGEEDQIWVGDYREDKRQILNLFNRLTRQVADEVMIELTPEEERLLAKSRTVDREAFDDYLKARSYANDFRKESLLKVMGYLNSAIEKEPDWAPLYAGLAELWIWIQQAGYESPSVAAPKIYENLNKAMELDPDLAEVHYLSAMIAHLVEWNWEKSEKEFLKTLAINPNDSWSRLLYSQLLLILQRNDEALAQIELAAGLDPFNPAEKLLYSGTLVQAGDFAAALSVAEELVAADSMDMNAKGMADIAAYNLGEYDKVIRSLKNSLPFSNEENVYEEIVRIYNESGIVAAYEELMKHMEKYAENNPIGFAGMAGGYIIANQPDKAMDWIEKGFEVHDPQITYITATGRFYEHFESYPGYLEILKIIKLPYLLE